MLWFIIFFFNSLMALVNGHVLPSPYKSEPIQLRDPENRQALAPRATVVQLRDSRHRHVLAPRAAAERQMWYVQSIYAGLGNVAMSGPDQGQMIFPVDTAIFFTGTATDGPLMVNLIWYNNAVAVQIYIWPVSSKGSVPSYIGSSDSIIQRSFLIGNTTLTNTQLWNPKGSGKNSTNTTSSASGTVHSRTGTAYSTGRIRQTGSVRGTGTVIGTGTAYGTGIPRHNGTSHNARTSSGSGSGHSTSTPRQSGSVRGTGTVVGTGTACSSGKSLMPTSTGTSLYHAPSSITKLKRRTPSSKNKRADDQMLTEGKIAQIVSEMSDTSEAKWAKDFLHNTMLLQQGINPDQSFVPSQEISAAQAIQDDYWDAVSAISDEDVSTKDTLFYEVENGETEVWAQSVLNDDGEPKLRQLTDPAPAKPKILFAPQFEEKAGDIDFKVDWSLNKPLATILEEDEYNTRITTTDEDSNAAKIANTNDIVAGGGEAPAGDTLSMTQSGGKLSLTMSLAQDIAKVVGIAAIAVGIAFIVVDFVDGNYVAGALSVASVVAGAAAIALSYVAVPFATVLADILGPLALLLAILPGLFTHVNPKPPANNGTEIIQWSFFGDFTKTGNEECRKGTPATKSSPGTPPSPNCEAVYGAGTLAVALKLTNYEATVLSIWANSGYAISIPDLAGKMCVMDDTEKNQCSNAPFQVDCKNRLGSPGPHGETIGGTGFTNCDSPTYAVQLNLITLPILNITADKIEPRIIGGPNAVSNADCKIVQFPGAQEFPKYNLTINGMPSGIACGLQDAWNIGGTAVPFNCGNDCTPGSVVSSGINSTTGGNGAVVDAPPAKPFAIPAQGNDYLCLEDGTSADAFCLPPLKYDSQGGKAFDIWKVKSADIPTGWSLETYHEVQPMGRGATRTIKVQHTYGPGQDQKELNEDMIGIHDNLYNAASFTISGTNPPGPLVCLFDQTKYNGNVICLGPGGTNLTSDWQNTAQSAKMWGAKATFYPDFYGNDAGQLQNGDIPDLSGLKYGTNQDLSKKTYGLLIEAAD